MGGVSAEDIRWALQDAVRAREANQAGPAEHMGDRQGPRLDPD